MAQQVAVTLDHGKIVLSRDPVTCAPGEQLTWTQPAGGSLTITLKDPVHTPFVLNPPYKSRTAGGTVDVQVKPLASLGSRHDYTVTLQMGGNSYQLDPTVIIDNTREMMNGDERAELLKATSEEIKNLLQQVLSRVTKAAESAEGIALFPQGINSISVDVEVTPVKVALTVSGPKS